MDSALQKELLRPSEVAEICGVARNTVYRWLSRRIFVPVKIGGNTYISGDALRAHLNGCLKLDTDPVGEYDDELGNDAEAMLLSFRDRRRS